MLFTEIRDGMITVRVDEHIAAMLAKACQAACYLTDHSVPNENHFAILGDERQVSIQYEALAGAIEAAALAANIHAEIPGKEQPKHTLTAWRATGPRSHASGDGLERLAAILADYLKAQQGETGGAA